MARTGDARRAIPACLDQETPADDVVLSVPQPELAGASAPALLGFTVELPLPPSANALFKSVGRIRAKSGVYRQWIVVAGHELAPLAARRVSGWYDLSVCVPLEMRGDNHNRFKAIGDLLVAHGLVDDDRFEFSTFMTRSAVVPPGRCVVTVSPRSPASSGVGCGPRPPSTCAVVGGG
jgi:hypothetical protein